MARTHPFDAALRGGAPSLLASPVAQQLKQARYGCDESGKRGECPRIEHGFLHSDSAEWVLEGAIHARTAEPGCQENRAINGDLCAVPATLS